VHSGLSSSLRSQLSNKTTCKPFGGHLISQTAQNSKQLITGPKPAQARIKALLGHDLGTNGSEILGHEYSLKYLSSHPAKAQVKDQLGLILSGQSTREIPLYPV